MLTSVVESLRATTRFQACQHDFQVAHDELIKFTSDLYMGYEYKKSGNPNETIKQGGAPFGALNRQLTHDRARFVHDIVTAAGGRCTVDISPAFKNIWVPNVLEFDVENNSTTTAVNSTTTRESCDLSFNQTNPENVENVDLDDRTINNPNIPTPAATTNEVSSNLVRHLGARRVSGLSSRSGKSVYTSDHLEQDSLEAAIRHSLHGSSNESQQSLTTQLKRKASTPNSSTTDEILPYRKFGRYNSAGSFGAPFEANSSGISNSAMSAGRTHSMMTTTQADTIVEADVLEIAPEPKLDPNNRLPRQMINVFNEMHPTLPPHADASIAPGLGDHGTNQESSHDRIILQLRKQLFSDLFVTNQ